MKHTEGPWRWEVNPKYRQVQLCGGVPKYDLTVIDFVRWGMNGAAPRFREDVRNMNIMHRCERWAIPSPGREHHASWFRILDHPDARLIQAAPKLLETVVKLREMFVTQLGDPFSGGDHEFLAEIDGVIKEAT